MTQTDTRADVEPIRDAIRTGNFRVTINETHLLQSGEVAVSARFETQIHPSARWKRVGPLLFGPKGTGVAGLLKVLEHLAE